MLNRNLLRIFPLPCDHIAFSQPRGEHPQANRDIDQRCRNPHNEAAQLLIFQRS